MNGANYEGDFTPDGSIGEFICYGDQNPPSLFQRYYIDT